MFGYFLGLKVCKFNILQNPSGPNVMAGLSVDSGVILNPNILREFSYSFNIIIYL